MTLREQFRQIACAELGEPFYKAAGFTRAVSAMCEHLLLKVWTGECAMDSLPVKVVVRCSLLLKNPGFVLEAEPGLVE